MEMELAVFLLSWQLLDIFYEIILKKSSDF